MPNPALLLGLVAGTAFASRTSVRIRMQSNMIGTSWTDLAVIVGLFLLPAPWMVVCTAVAITVSRLFTGTPAQRVLFIVGKDTFATAAVGALFVISGYRAAPAAPVLNVGLIAAAS